MKNINIISGNVDNMASEIVKKVQTEIIDASAASRDTLIGILDNSSGDFIDSLKTEVIKEADTINAIGELLIEAAKYVQSAAHAFANVDAAFNTSIMK